MKLFISSFIFSVIFSIIIVVILDRNTNMDNRNLVIAFGGIFIALFVISYAILRAYFNKPKKVDMSGRYWIPDESRMVGVVPPHERTFIEKGMKDIKYSDYVAQGKLHRPHLQEDIAKSREQARLKQKLLEMIKTDE